jgi:hypothetical protein
MAASCHHRRCRKCLLFLVSRLSHQQAVPPRRRMACLPPVLARRRVAQRWQLQQHRCGTAISDGRLREQVLPNSRLSRRHRHRCHHGRSLCCLAHPFARVPSRKGQVVEKAVVKAPVLMHSPPCSSPALAASVGHQRLNTASPVNRRRRVTLPTMCLQPAVCWSDSQLHAVIPCLRLCRHRRHSQAATNRFRQRRFCSSSADLLPALQASQSHHRACPKHCPALALTATSFCILRLRYHAHLGRSHLLEQGALAAAAVVWMTCILGCCDHMEVALKVAVIGVGRGPHCAVDRGRCR